MILTIKNTWKRRRFLWLVRVKPFLYWLTHRRCRQCGGRPLAKYKRVCGTCGLRNIAFGIFDDPVERETFMRNVGLKR